MAQLNFNLLSSQAKEIDKEIIYLKAKILEPSKFGLGREEAVEALKGVDKEFFYMKNKCSQELEIAQEDNESLENDIKNLKDYLKNLGDNLDKIEANALKYGYETYENQGSKKRKITDFSNLSGITELSMADSQFTPVFPHRKRYGGQKPPSIVIEHDFRVHSSTPK